MAKNQSQIELIRDLAKLSAMRHVFIFHGTEGHPEENWFPWLKSELEKTGNFTVHTPQFPTPGTDQTPEKWFNVLEQYREFLNEETIIIGHSLGGAFALRVLEKFKVNAAYIVAAPAGVRPILNWEGDQPFIGPPFEWTTIRNNAKTIEAFHSDNDPYICLGNGKLIAEKLGITLNFIPRGGHFNMSAGYTEFQILKDMICKKS